MVAGLATLQAFDDEDIVDRARRTGERVHGGARAPGRASYEFLHEVRGKGLMIGLEFGAPAVAGAAAAVQRCSSGCARRLFSQIVVVPLFHRHRILTQVAADNVNIVKLLPPLIAGEEEIDYFVDALDDVLADAHRSSGLLVEVGRTMAATPCAAGAGTDGGRGRRPRAR